jgi:hypothetical protein
MAMGSGGLRAKSVRKGVSGSKRRSGGKTTRRARRRGRRTRSERTLSERQRRLLMWRGAVMGAD